VRTLKQSTAYNLTVFMTDSSDHVSGKTGLTLTITASKDGGAFASISPTVTELANGWYKVALTSSHADTLGDLALHVTSTGADPTDLVSQVRANILGDTLPANATQIDGASWSTHASGMVPADLRDIAGAAVSTSSAQLGVNVVNLGGTSQTGRDIGASVLIASGSGAGQLDVTSGVIKANLAQILGTALTETAGQIAGAFKKFFNVATPTGTVNSIPDAVAGAASGLATVGSNMGSVTAVGTGGITSASFAAGAIDAAAIAADAIGSSELAASAATEIATAVTGTSCTEPTAAVAASPSLIAAISWLLTLSRNKIEQTATTQTLRADDGTTAIASATLSDDGTTMTKGEFA